MAGARRVGTWAKDSHTGPAAGVDTAGPPKHSGLTASTLEGLQKTVEEGGWVQSGRTPWKGQLGTGGGKEV